MALYAKLRFLTNPALIHHRLDARHNPSRDRLGLFVAKARVLIGIADVAAESELHTIQLGLAIGAAFPNALNRGLHVFG